MRQVAGRLPGFPLLLFVRSLHKVHDILEGAFTVARPEGSTQRRQQTEPDTLGHYLQDLDRDRANDRLERLAREVGVVLNADRDLPLGWPGRARRGLRSGRPAAGQRRPAGLPRPSGLPGPPVRPGGGPGPVPPAARPAAPRPRRSGYGGLLAGQSGSSNSDCHVWRACSTDG
jgi:hypothetical protein